ncbi:hypothetical protein [Burkholderia multivorans]|uniref:hypothetical protein n=1 Tax=Burkholderia multivorans TaxID=87883 RepID=UPI001C23C8E2|nr:hypothetical protein [Burkholderia multivorans]MBU9224074.1 hypothetical protein [Burkholderia multivorans]MBU9479719.1 hypothetical protein [Burkholderia multivorans]
MSDTNYNVGSPKDDAGAPSQSTVNTSSHPTTQLHKTILVVLHLLLTAVMMTLAYFTIQKFNEATFVETSTSWELPTGTHLKDGPAGFHYDPDHRTLTYRGPLNTQQQLQLRDLLEFDTAASGAAASATPPSAVNATIHSYHAAIDRLAFQTGAAQVEQVQLLLLLGFMGGTLGAILRSLVDFVGHACYTGKLDLRHWWPLYATRPIVGAILGFVLVALLKARLLTSIDTQQGNESFWWLGVAVLGGFSTVDVTQRLRLAAKALFGTTHDNSSSGGSAPQ